VTTAVKVPTDIAIAQAAKLRPIADIAAELRLDEDEVEYYGKYKAKLSLAALERRTPVGRLVLVTGITPTPAGEGKSTVTVGVATGVGTYLLAARLLRIEELGLLMAVLRRRRRGSGRA